MHFSIGTHVSISFLDDIKNASCFWNGKRVVTAFLFFQWFLAQNALDIAFNYLKSWNCFGDFILLIFFFNEFFPLFLTLLFLFWIQHKSLGTFHCILQLNLGLSDFKILIVLDCWITKWINIIIHCSSVYEWLISFPAL